MKSGRWLVQAAVLAVLVWVVALPAGAAFEVERKLTAPDGAPGDNFGLQVDISGDTAVVGASDDDDNGSNSGSAYVFVLDGSTWSLQQKLTASDGATEDLFGISVAVSGDTVLVGALFDDDNGSNSGSAYVFTRSGSVWTEQDKLTASDGAAEDWFGESVAMDGDTALVGATKDDDNGSSSGSAYVFTRSGSVWTEQDKLTASDGAALDLFGISVALEGDTALVGAFGDDDNGASSGSAYVFTRSGSVWTEQDKLIASDGEADDFFAESVALSGDTAAVGADGDDDNGDVSGSAYVFTRSGSVWTEQDKLTASDGVADDFFGTSVAIVGDTAVIGAFRDDDNGPNSGSAYVFTRSGSVWTEQDKLTASDGMEDDKFGASIALSGDTAIMGAAGDDDNGSNSGSAYAFQTPAGVQILPEGATHSGFTTFVVLANPSETTAATVDLTFLTPTGPLSPSSVHDLTIAPGRRRTVNVNDELGIPTDVATKVTSFGTQVVAEVAVHKSGSLAVMEMGAASESSSSWIIPEGATHSGFTTFITIANPDPTSSTHVDLDYLTGSGGLIDGVDNLEIPAGGRRTVSANTSLASGGCGCQDDVSTKVTVLGSEPGVVAGMSLHKLAGGDLGIGGSLALTDSATTWVVAEGATHSGFSTFVLVANPGVTPATATVTYLTPSGSFVGTPLNLAAGTRKTISVNFDLAGGYDVSTLIQATSGEVAVESSVQKLDATGFVIADSVGSGGLSVGDASDPLWLAAEGVTHSGFTTFILIANPDTASPATATLTFFTPGGTIAGPTINIGAGARQTVPVNLYAPGQDVSTLVEATSGRVVVELSVDRVVGGLGFLKGRDLAARLEGP